MDDVPQESLGLSYDPLHLHSPRGGPQYDPNEHYRLSVKDLNDFVISFSNGCSDLPLNIREEAFETYEKTEFIQLKNKYGDTHLGNMLYDYLFAILSDLDTTVFKSGKGIWSLTPEERSFSTARMLGITFAFQVGPFADIGLVDNENWTNWTKFYGFFSKFSKFWRCILSETYSEGKFGGEQCFGITFDSRAKLVSLLAHLQNETNIILNEFYNRDLDVGKYPAKLTIFKDEQVKILEKTQYSLRITDVTKRLTNHWYRVNPLDFYVGDKDWESKRVQLAEKQLEKQEQAPHTAFSKIAADRKNGGRMETIMKRAAGAKTAIGSVMRSASAIASVMKSASATSIKSTTSMKSSTSMKSTASSMKSITSMKSEASMKSATKSTGSAMRVSTGSAASMKSATSMKSTGSAMKSTSGMKSAMKMRGRPPGPKSIATQTSAAGAGTGAEMRGRASGMKKSGTIGTTMKMRGRPSGIKKSGTIGTTMKMRGRPSGMKKSGTIGTTMKMRGRPPGVKKSGATATTNKIMKSTMKSMASLSMKSAVPMFRISRNINHSNVGMKVVKSANRRVNVHVVQLD